MGTDGLRKPATSAHRHADDKATVSVNYSVAAGHRLMVVVLGLGLTGMGKILFPKGRRRLWDEAS